MEETERRQKIDALFERFHKEWQGKSAWQISTSLGRDPDDVTPGSRAHWPDGTMVRYERDLIYWLGGMQVRFLMLEDRALSMAVGTGRTPKDG